MKSLTPREIFLKNIAQTSPFPLGLEIKSARGIELFGTDGTVYKDMISGISVSNLGHSHPEVVEAVKMQAEKHMHLMVYGEYIQSPQIELADLVTSLLPSSLSAVYFVNSGTEAVEGAMKLAKKFTGRYEIVAYKNAYHGSTLGSLSLMGDEELKTSFRPLVPGIKHIELNSEADLEFISDKTACVIIEPVQGEAGVRIATRDYLEKLRKRCDDTGALLIFDEIQTGMGRTGKLFCFEHYNIVPDVLLLAKAFGGGMPLGAFISSKEIMQCLSTNPPLAHITTFGGHPVCCAAAAAALKVLQRDNLVDEVSAKEELFRKLLYKNSAIKDLRSMGLLIAVDLGDEQRVQKTLKKCLAAGYIFDWFLFDPRSIRIAPPLIITEDEIRKACAVLTDGMK